MSAWDHSPQIVGPKLANRRLVGRVCNKTLGVKGEDYLRVGMGLRNRGLAGEFLLTQMMNPSSVSFDSTSPCRRIGSSSDAKI